MLFVAAAVAAETVTVQPAGPIRIDGFLDEPAWANAAPVTDFRRFQPTEGGAPPGATEVRFLQDDKNLYVGIRVRDAGYPLRARVSPREAINADDQVGVYLDTFDDGISGYIFYFNPLGIQQDIRHNAGNWNASWDTVLKSRGRVTDGGFELEVAFPWRSLKFPKGQDQTWGLVLTRKVPHEGAKYSWPQLERGTPRVFENANRLAGINPPNRGSGLELQPSFAAGQSWPVESAPIGDNLRPSLDARIGITPDLGITATLNPDFSQVESDVSDVRVNAQFGFQFRERRPFFLDGIDWFEDRGNALYTRTMNQPVYGLKFSGREGPVTLGALHVLDRSPLPTFTEGGTPGFNEEDIGDAWASNSLLRTRVDAFGLGYAGVVLADKRLLGTSSSQQLAGVDFEAPLGKRWYGGGNWLHSFTGDDDERRWGAEQNLQVWRASGIGTAGGFSFSNSTPDFRKEMGFLTQADVTDANVWMNHTFTPSGLISTFTPSISNYVRFEGNGDRYLNLNIGQVTVVNGVHRLFSNGWLQQFGERGAVVNGAGGLAGASLNIGRALDLTFEGVGGRVIDFGSLEPALTASLSTTITLRPTPNLRSDTSLRWNGLSSPSNGPSTASLIRNRLTYQLSRSLGTRWVLDYSKRTESDPRLFNSLLVTWLRNHGTAVWVGGSAVYVPDIGFTEGAIFAKLSLLLRP